MVRRLSSRRLLWPPSMLLRQSSNVQFCLLSRLYRAAIAFRPDALLLSFRYSTVSLSLFPFIIHYLSLFVPISSLTPLYYLLSLSSSLSRSNRSMSYESASSDVSAGLLPTSVFSMNSSTSATALSLNRVFTFLRPVVSIVATSLSFSFRIIVSRSICHGQAVIRIEV